MLNIRNSKAGFTLVEVMVAMAISGVVLASIVKVYSAQLKTHTTQQQVVEMQQTMRAILYLMERDIRMAGYAPQGGLSDPIISIAKNDEIQFVMDITGGETDGLDNDGDGNTDETTAGEEFDGTDNDSDGAVDEADEADESRYGDGDSLDAGEHIRYYICDKDDVEDLKCDEDDIGVLFRNADYGDGAGIHDETLADHIDALTFVYLDENGMTLDDDGAGNVVAGRSQIRSVVVTLTGTVGTNPGAKQKEMSLAAEIKGRNLGLASP